VHREKPFRKSVLWVIARPILPKLAVFLAWPPFIASQHAHDVCVLGETCHLGVNVHVRCVHNVLGFTRPPGKLLREPSEELRQNIRIDKPGKLHTFAQQGEGRVPPKSKW
jgi:hypothetical protein